MTRCAAPSRAAFTLIETVVAMAISVVLLLALGSAVVIASKAIPTGQESVVTEGVIERGLAVMAADIEVATAVNRTSGLVLTVPDRDGDGADDTITYQLSGTPKYLYRSRNGSTPVALFGPVSSSNITPIMSGGSLSALKVELTIDNATPTDRTLIVELLNRPG